MPPTKPTNKHTKETTPQSSLTTRKTSHLLISIKPPAIILITPSQYRPGSICPGRNFLSSPTSRFVVPDAFFSLCPCLSTSNHQTRPFWPQYTRRTFAWWPNNPPLVLLLFLLLSLCFWSRKHWGNNNNKHRTNQSFVRLIDQLIKLIDSLIDYLSGLIKHSFRRAIICSNKLGQSKSK